VKRNTKQKAFDFMFDVLFDNFGLFLFQQPMRFFCQKFATLLQIVISL
jgi:hypothetical protein